MVKFKQGDKVRLLLPSEIRKIAPTHVIGEGFDVSDWSDEELDDPDNYNSTVLDSGPTYILEMLRLALRKEIHDISRVYSSYDWMVINGFTWDKAWLKSTNNVVINKSILTIMMK